MYLVKRKDGAYVPFDDSDYSKSQKIPGGDVLKASQPRNYKHHKLAFALLNQGFENQDKYKTLEIYRKVMTILAGYYDEVEDKHGDIHYIPKSLSYENMSQQDFEQWYDAMCVVVAHNLSISVEELKGEL